MTKILVLAEHDNNSLSGATLSVVKAAEMLGDEIDLICTTSNISNLETEISALSSVKRFMSLKIKYLKMKLQKIL